jgi:hypothetical protein
LKLIGQLSMGEATLSELAEKTDLQNAEAAHHLDLLEQAGLVALSPGTQGVVYQLKTKDLEAFARQQLASRHAPPFSPPGDYSDEERKIIANYARRDGTLKQIPLQPKKVQAILKYVSTPIEGGVRYTEKEINAILARFHPDSTTLRRYLVDYHILGRENDGSSYWRLESGYTQPAKD